MLRSMYSGISGMKNFQVKLDVIGNNIANVNTYGFKKGRTTFKDLVSQQISGASAPTAGAGGRGGVNPKQVGLGSQLATIDTVHTQGSLQTTARPLDLGISGDGFFVVNDGTNDYLTRAGNFYLDKSGNLVNSDGMFVKGYEPTPTNNGVNTGNASNIVIPSTAKSFSIGPDGTVNYIIEGASEPKVAGQIFIAKFSNDGALEKAGGNLYRESSNSGLPLKNSPTTYNGAVVSAPGKNGAGTLVAGALEMSNVDLSEEFTEMIVAQRGFQANTRIITTSDEILQELVNLKR
ncbi:flagellar basal-body rod protein FlgG [Fictibacillus phosphorivorans]|uniref:Flagellar hook protein FlgE n=1 Tax=Fictibacillus phosphorivorans TaxID=1221500 RepID=A0A160ILQ7_9BACL|nr:flagellar basal body rod protein FlgG [Fictibacillus phosphorivorans]ANC76867.1 flagellar basal-body rod protein FlgG [Fictibacillus phosphorivorans]